LAFRPRWFDLPMLGWCLCPIASSLDNGLGIYDGLSEALTLFVYWGLPYLIGRLYFNDLTGLHELTLAMVVGGLAYIPPCLFEFRMSDQLLSTIYGFGAGGGARNGVARAKVFFWTPLECGMWMAAAALTAWWLWRCGALRKIGGIRFGGGLLAMLIGTEVLCQSMGAVILMLGGMGLLWASARFQTRLLLGALALFGPIYGVIRIPNLWSGQQLVQVANTLINKERAQSWSIACKTRRFSSPRPSSDRSSAGAAGIAPASTASGTTLESSIQTTPTSSITGSRSTGCGWPSSECEDPWD
jgi:hypothetical protein